MLKQYVSKLLGICFVLLISYSARSQVTVNFVADDTVVCPGAPVAFSNTSSVPAGYTASYSWTFPGGFASSTTIANPTVYYYTPGNYTVTLTLTVPGLGTFSKTKTSYIKVVTPSDAAYTYSYPDLCNKLQVNFTSTSVAGDGPITSYLWDFDDGTFSTSASPTKTFATAGTYDVILFITDANGCSDNYTIPVTVTPPLSTSINVTGLTHSCGTSITPTIAATTTGGTAPYTYSWDYGNGTTSTLASSPVTYTGCGKYDIVYTVTDVNGCTVTKTYNDYINIACPVANFSMSEDTICQNGTVAFTNLSDAGATSYNWQFTYPAASPSSTLTNPSYTYTVSGTKLIRLTATYPDGCVAIRTDTIVIHPKPLIGGITATDSFACDVPLTVTLGAYGVTGALPITYLWNVGGMTSTSLTPTFTLTSAINYDVSLTVTDANGCSSTLLQTGFIKIKKPVIDMHADIFEGCAPLSVTFTNSSSSLYVPLDHFDWDFDDGTTMTTYTTGTVTHIYTEPGTYHPEMTLYTVEGCPKTVGQTIVVGDTVAYYEFVDTLMPVCNPVEINNQSGGSDETTVDWGDGIISTITPPNGDTLHIYTVVDTTTFVVVMTCEDRGCVSTWIDSVTVLPVESPASSVWDCFNPTFSIITIDTTLIHGDFCLDFHNGDTICYENPVSYDFGAPGTYPVTIIPFGTVEEQACPLSMTFYTTVPEITPSFSPVNYELCHPGLLEFTSTSTVENTVIVDYTWQIGPGEATGITDTYSSLSPDFSYTFTDEDVYPITLTLTDEYGCSFSFTDTVFVGSPVAAIVVDSIIGCSPKTLYLSNGSTVVSGSGGYITNYSWGFDGLYPVSHLETPPVHDFPNGVWEVTLVVMDNFGCTGSVVDTFDFSNVLTASFISDSLSCSSDDPLHFINTSGGTYDTILWDFGDGTTDTTTDGHHFYASEGFYTVTLTLSDTLGCVNTYADSFNVVLDDLEASYDLDYLTGASCPPIPIQLTNTSSADASSFYWEVEREAGTFTYYYDTLLFTYTIPGDYGVTLVAQSVHGCVDTMSNETAIHIAGPTGTMSLSPASGCTPLTVNFDLEDLDADLVYIDMGDGDTILVTGDYSYTYTGAGTYCPSLILLDSTGCSFSLNCVSTVTALASPTAVLSLSDSSICVGDSVTIYNASYSDAAYPITEYILDYADGTIDTFTTAFDSLPYFYPEGTYPISLITNNAVCSDTASVTALVNTLPAAMLDYTPVAGCADLVVDFTLSALTADDVLINFGNGDSLFISGDTSYTYTEAGQFVPYLVLNTLSGCDLPVEGTDTITVLEQPVISFSLSDTDLCAGGAVTIYNTDTSMAAASASYIINFGDGTVLTPSVFDSLTHIYTTAGSHLVTAIADNGFCTDSLSANLNVHDIPAATMDYATMPGCYDLAVVFSFTGLTADSITFFTGDGASFEITGDTSYIYTAAGNYLPSVQLLNTSGCNQLLNGNDTIKVYDTPVAEFALSDSAICAGASITIYNTDTADIYSSPVNYTIDFGDGTTITAASFDSLAHIYATAGSPVITVTADNGFCADSTSRTMNVDATPSATMDYTPIAGCIDLAVDFTFTGLTADTILLNYGDGTSEIITGDVSHIYAAAADYIPSITLHNITGCNQALTGSDTIHIYDLPVAGVDINDTSICEGASVTIYNTSTAAALSPAYTYTVYYGDGGSDVFTSLDSVTHTYSTPADYIVSLVADNGYCTDSATAMLHVEDIPSAVMDYAPLAGCSSLSVDFTFTGLSADAVILSYGDGSTGVITGDVSHTYGTPGNYLPSVSLYNISGCNQALTGSDTIHVYDNIAASFSMSDTAVCEGGTITIYNTMPALLYSPDINYTIDFGDGSFTSLADFDSVSHTYALPGTPVISVLADNGYCSDSVTAILNVNDIPSATLDYTPLAGCTALSVDFTFTGLTADSITIFYGDGNSSSITGDVNYMYATPGNYLPSVSLHNTTGCNQDANGADSIHVYDEMAASFSLSDSAVCEGGVITIYNTAAVPAFSPTVNYTIDFGDGSSVTTSVFDSVAHTYTLPGTPVISVSADNGYCSDSSSITLQVDDIPSAVMDYTPLAGCADLSVDFTFTGLIADSITLYYGDGTAASISGDVNYTYATPGNYLPYIALHNVSGCNQDANGSDSIHVYDQIVSSFTISDSSLCEGETVTIYNTAPALVYSPAINYTIDFGDGTSSVLTDFDSITHTYALPGTPLISVLADNGYCSDSSARTVSVNDIPSATMDYTPLAGCTALTVDFSFTGLTADSITLYYGDGSSAEISAGISYTYATSGNYLPYIALNNTSGCNQMLNGDDSVKIYDAPVASFTVSDLSPCEGQIISVYNTAPTGLYSPAINFDLDFGDGTSTTLLPFDSVTHTYSSPDIYGFELIADNGYCSDTAYASFTVNDVPSATMDYTPLIGCENLSVDFTFTGLIADTITMHYGDGTSTSVSGDISYIYASPGAYIPQIELNNTTGCNQMLGGDDTIHIHYAPVAGVKISDTLQCLGESMTVYNAAWDTSYSPITNYSIDYGDGSPVYSVSSFDSVLHTYPAPATYMLKMYVENAGCNDSITQEIVVAPIPGASLNADPLVGCGSLLTDFSFTSVTADSLSLFTGESTMDISTPALSYDYTTPGVYYPVLYLADVTGCKNIITLTDSVVVSYVPEALFTVSGTMPYCSGEEIYIVNQSIDSVTNPFINPIDDVIIKINGSVFYSADVLDSVAYTMATPGDYTITMITLNDLGCSDSMTTVITVHETPVAVAGYDTTICPGMTITLDGTASSGGYIYNWSPAAILNDNALAEPTGLFIANTTMVLTYANDYCSATDSVLINVLDDLELVVGPDTAICYGNSVQLYSNYNGAGGDVQMIWLQGDYLNSTLVDDPISTPENTITYTASAQCGNLIAYDDVNIIVNPLPLVAIADTATMILDEPITLDAIATSATSVDYLWTPSDFLNCATCASVVASATHDMMYFVTVTDENSCVATDSIYLRVVWNCAGEGIEVANIMTPNNDGFNDRFEFRTEAVKELFYFNIYDRWGALMFSSDDVNKTWDGTYNGIACNAGVYVYTIKGICFDDELFIKTGNVTLVR